MNEGQPVEILTGLHRGMRGTINKKIPAENPSDDNSSNEEPSNKTGKDFYEVKTSIGILSRMFFEEDLKAI